MKHKGLALMGEHPQFAKYWMASLVSIFGDQVGWIALIWLVLRIGGDPAAIGIVTFLYLAPQAVLAPLAGVWLDRLPKARAMAIANGLVGGMFLAIPWVIAVGGSGGLPVVYVLVALAGCALAFDATGSAPILRPTLWIAAAGMLASFLPLYLSPIRSLANPTAELKSRDVV